MNLHQYAIVLVNLDPMVGSEMKKTRPCVIVSPDEMHLNLRTYLESSTQRMITTGY